MFIKRERQEEQEKSGDGSGTESSNRGSLEEDGRRRFLSIGGVHEQREMIGKGFPPAFRLVCHRFSETSHCDMH